jgi:3-phenylpropionate/trans-cinnamate dioxygenase ferredoxin subunit
MVQRATLVDACSLEQLTTDQCLQVRVAGRPVGLVLHQGRPVAVLNDCPHFHGPLAQGPISVTRGEIICPWHRFRFELGSGRSATNPDMVATLLPTEVRGDRVWVDVSGLADPTE